MTDNALAVREENGGLAIVPKDTVMAIAARLWEIYPQPYNKKFHLSKRDVAVGTELALANGVNPLAIGREYFLWKDNTGLCFMLHYGRDVRWAQDREPFREHWHEWTNEEKAGAGIDKRDFVFDCTLIRQSQERAIQNMYQTILNAALKAGKELKESLALAEKESLKMGVTATGKVKYVEVYDDNGKLRRGGAGDIKGWVPGVSRAKVRAMRNAIKAAYGTPTMQDMISLGVSPAQASGIAEMPEEIIMENEKIQSRYLELVESDKRSREDRKAKMELLTPEEYNEQAEKRVTKMRGDGAENDPNWLDEAPEEIEVSPVSEAAEESHEENNADFTIGDLKMAMHSAGYSTQSAQEKGLKTIYGEGARFDGLNKVQKHNLIQLMFRLKVLIDTSIEPEKRLGLIPEIVKAESPPKTLKNAKAWLKKLAEVMSSNDQEMEVLKI